MELQATVHHFSLNFFLPSILKRGTQQTWVFSINPPTFAFNYINSTTRRMWVCDYTKSIRQIFYPRMTARAHTGNVHVQILIYVIVKPSNQKYIKKYDSKWKTKRQNLIMIFARISYFQVWYAGQNHNSYLFYCKSNHLSIVSLLPMQRKTLKRKEKKVVLYCSTWTSPSSSF